jgi:hypothetical protein
MQPSPAAPLTVASFDPGSDETRYCILRGTKHEQRYVGSGKVGSSDTHLESFVRNLAPDVDAFAVETTGRFQPDPRVVLSLLRTAEVAGKLIGLALATGKPVFTLPANAPRGKLSWRVLLCGQRDGERAGDRTVRTYLRMVLPDLPAKCNEHERDAAGLGVIALRCNLKDPTPTARLEEYARELERRV